MLLYSSLRIHISYFVNFLQIVNFILDNCKLLYSKVFTIVVDFHAYESLYFFLIAYGCNEIGQYMNFCRAGP